jgi:hypothetical protein
MMEVIWIDAGKQLEYYRSLTPAQGKRFVRRLADAVLRQNKRDLRWLNSLDFVRLVDPEKKPQ